MYACVRVCVCVCACVRARTVGGKKCSPVLSMLQAPVQKKRDMNGR